MLSFISYAQSGLNTPSSFCGVGFFLGSGIRKGCDEAALVIKYTCPIRTLISEGGVPHIITFYRLLAAVMKLETVYDTLHIKPP